MCHEGWALHVVMKRKVLIYVSICRRHVVGHVVSCKLYCNWMIIVCGLPYANRQRYTDTLKSLGIDKCDR